jgi:hypothetical protein
MHFTPAKTAGASSTSSCKTGTYTGFGLFMSSCVDDPDWSDCVAFHLWAYRGFDMLLPAT